VGSRVWTKYNCGTGILACVGFTFCAFYDNGSAHAALLNGRVYPFMFLRLTFAAGALAFAALAQQQQQKPQQQQAPQQQQQQQQFTPPPESSHEYGPDNYFLVQAVRGSRTDVELGQLAQKRATDPAVKNFANQMVQSGNAMLQSLQGVAAMESVAVPNLPSAAAVAEMQQLQNLPKARFDRSYMQFMVDHLQKQAGQLDRENKQGMNPKLKGFAAANLPKANTSLSQAQKIEQQLNAGGPSNANSGRE
jgi:putative membrane protein